MRLLVLSFFTVLATQVADETRLSGALGVSSDSDVVSALDGLAQGLVDEQLNSNTLNYTVNDFCDDLERDLGDSLRSLETLRSELHSQIEELTPRLLAKRTRKMGLQQRMDETRKNTAEAQELHRELQEEFSERDRQYALIIQQLHEKHWNSPVNELLEHFQTLKGLSEERLQQLNYHGVIEKNQHLFVKQNAEYAETTPAIISLESQIDFYEDSISAADTEDTLLGHLASSLVTFCAHEASSYSSELRSRQRSLDELSGLAQLFIDRAAEIDEYSRAHTTQDLLT